MKKTSLVVLVVALAVGAALLVRGVMNSDRQNGGNVQNGELQRAESGQIRVEHPRINEVVTSPLVARGEARGTWFFEADFPVVLYDANGRVLASGYAMTAEEWMTENFVSFESIPLAFAAPETDTGFLILYKDNPAGDERPDLDDEIMVPVRFR